MNGRVGVGSRGVFEKYRTEFAKHGIWTRHFPEKTVVPSMFCATVLYSATINRKVRKEFSDKEIARVFESPPSNAEIKAPSQILIVRNSESITNRKAP